MKLALALLIFAAVPVAYGQTGISYDNGPTIIALVTPTGSNPYGYMTTTGTSGQVYDYAPTAIILGYNTTTKHFYACGTANPCTGAGGGGGTGSGTVNSGTAYSPAYYGATGTAVSGITPCSGLELLSTTAGPSCATPAQVQAASTDTTKNSSIIYSYATGGDTGLVTPSSSNVVQDEVSGGLIYRSYAGAAFAPVIDKVSATSGQTTVTLSNDQATVGLPSVGTPLSACGSATQVCSITTDAQGRVTVGTPTTITGTGTAPTLQTNSTNNSSQTTLNLITSTVNSAGLTATPSNTTGGTVKFEITGTPAQPTDLPYTVAGNPTGTSATRAATTNPVTATVSTYAASGLFYIGAAAGGSANCTQGTVSGCTGFIEEVAAGVWSFDTTTAGNGLATVKMGQIQNSLMQSSALATVASATTIAPTTPLVVISGTTAIATITLPSGFVSGCFDIRASGAWTTTTAGNIQATMTAVANSDYRACYWTDISKWVIK